MSDRVTILHTNDLHNHLTEHQAVRLADLRRTAGNSALLLDAGDAVGSGNVTFRPGGEPILDRMSAIGYDAMCVGNREFHFSEIGFRTKVARAAFPVLCANVRPNGHNRPLPVHRSRLFVLDGGVRVGIFGVTVPMITPRMLARKVSAWVFDEPIAAAKAMADELRNQCDLLICLSHCGLAQDRKIADRAPSLDLLVGGHTHALLPEGERIGRTLVVQAGAFGKNLGTVVMVRERNGWNGTAQVTAL